MKKWQKETFTYHERQETIEFGVENEGQFLRHFSRGPGRGFEPPQGRHCRIVRVRCYCSSE